MISVLGIGLVFIIGIFAWIFIIYTYFANKGSRLTLAGPSSSNPFLGNALDVVRAGGFFEYLRQLHDDYGPVALFSLYDKQLVSVSTPELFALQADWSDRPECIFLPLINLLGEKSLQLHTGDEARRIRRCLDCCLSYSALEKRLHNLKLIADRILDPWMDFLHDETIPISEYAIEFAMESIISMCFGTNRFPRSKISINQFCQLFNSVWDELEMMVIEPKRHYSAEFHLNIDKLRSVVTEMIVQCENDKNDGYLLDEIVKIVESRDEMVDLCMSYLVGGYQTIANLLIWTVYHLAGSSEIQDQIHMDCSSEYARLIELDKGDSTSKMPPSLKRALDETLRMDSLCPATARISTREIFLKGQAIPSGTHFAQALAVLFGNEKFFPNADKFDPDRFLDPPLSSFHFCPFGFSGGRACPGIHLVYLSANCFFRTILQNYRIKLANPNEKVSKKSGIVTRPCSDIWIKIDSRSQ